MRINTWVMGHYVFFHPRQNFDTFPNLDADPSGLADTIRTVSDFLDAFADLLIYRSVAIRIYW